MNKKEAMSLELDMVNAVNYILSLYIDDAEKTTNTAWPQLKEQLKKLRSECGDILDAARREIKEEIYFNIANHHDKALAIMTKATKAVSDYRYK